MRINGRPPCSFNAKSEVMHLVSVRLQTRDVAAAADFYHQQLGLPLLKQTATEAHLQIGTSRLIFEQTTADPSPYYHFACNIPHNQLEAAQQWLQAFVPLLPVDTDGHYIVDFKNWNAHSIYFLDSVGNIVELIARHDLRNDSHLPFGSHQWLNVSEVGLVCADVGATAQMIAEQYGVPVFEKAGIFSDFGAMGTDEGLFILSKQGRYWFPTHHIESVAFPLTVVFRQQTKEWTLTQ